MALGFFDGVHLGHQQLIKTAKDIACRKGLEFTVLTFFPHPKEVIRDGNVDYLIPMERKIEIFEQLGVERLYIVPFDKIVADVEPQEFINFLVTLNAEEIVVGFDFTYGKKGLGTIHTIEEHGNGRFRLTVVPKFTLKGNKVSSTLIRKLINAGEIERVTECLGSQYQTIGRLIKIQFGMVMDSVQLQIHPYYLIPKQGSYFVEVTIGNEILVTVCHVLSSAEKKLEIELPKELVMKRFKTVKIKWIKTYLHASQTVQQKSLLI